MNSIQPESGVIARLNAANARLISEIKGPNKSTLKVYLLQNQRMVIVQVFADEEGFEVFATLTTSDAISDVESALDDLISRAA